MAFILFIGVFGLVGLLLYRAVVTLSQVEEALRESERENRAFYESTRARAHPSAHSRL